MIADVKLRVRVEFESGSFGTLNLTVHDLEYSTDKALGGMILKQVEESIAEMSRDTGEIVRSWNTMHTADWENMKEREHDLLDRKFGRIPDTIEVLRRALKLSVLDAACDETCPSELYGWDCPTCRTCPNGDLKQAELHHNTERDVACWMEYYRENAREEIDDEREKRVVIG